MAMFLKASLVLTLGLPGVLAGPFQPEEGIRTLNFTRPVAACADSDPQRIYYSGEQSYNFTEFYYADKFHKAGEYGLSYVWAKDYMFGDSMVSRKGNRDINALNWRCLRRCLAMDHCASFVLLKDLSSTSKSGFHQCQFFSKPVRRENMELQDSTATARAMRVYNLVCPENIQDYFRNAPNTIGVTGVKGGPFGDDWQSWEVDDNAEAPDGGSLLNDEDKVKEWKDMESENENKLREQDNTELHENDKGDRERPVVPDDERDGTNRSSSHGNGKDSVGRPKDRGSGKEDTNNGAETWRKEPKNNVSHAGDMVPHHVEHAGPIRDDDGHAKASRLGGKKKQSQGIQPYSNRQSSTDDSYFSVKAATDRNKAYMAEVNIETDDLSDGQIVDDEGFRGLGPGGSRGRENNRFYY